MAVLCKRNATSKKRLKTCSICFITSEQASISLWKQKLKRPPGFLSDLQK